MNKPTLYHNPRCTKSRQTLALLESKGIVPNVVAYLENPPNKTELRNILSMLGLSAIELMRQQEPEFKAQGLSDASLTENELIEAMINTPKLIERPILVIGNKAAIGRPPEKVLEIL